MFVTSVHTMSRSDVPTYTPSYHGYIYTYIHVYIYMVDFSDICTRNVSFSHPDVILEYEGTRQQIQRPRCQR